MKQQNFFENLNKIKEFESEPRIVKIFDSEEIKNILDFYNKLPLGTFNEKQKIKKKHWLLGFDENMDKFIKSKINKVLNGWKIDNMYSDKPAFGIFHESFYPLKLHVDSGRDKNCIIYKQILIPLTDTGDTILFEPRWYGPSSSFTIDQEELKNKDGYNSRTSEHLGDANFDENIYNQYLTHENINNLKGLKVKKIYEWKVGEALIFDRSFIHCSSTLKKPKIGLTIFFKKLA